MAGPLMGSCSVNGIAQRQDDGHVLELPNPSAQLRGLSQLAADRTLQAAAHQAEGAESPEHASCPLAAMPPSDLQSRTSEWIGAEVRTVEIAGREYRLSFVYLGTVEGQFASASIDP